MSRFKREWSRIYPQLREDIFKLCEYFNFKPTKQQARALRAVQEESRLPLDQRKKRLAIKSGQGTGKTTVSVIVAVWRTLQFVDAMTIVTAPTMRQLTDVFMAEAKRVFQRAHPTLRAAVEFTSTKIIFADRRETWLINCRTATKPENFQGYHDKYLTFMVDEASGVPAGIFEQIFGTLTNEDSLLFAIGNPNKRACLFFDFFNRHRSMWHAFTFNAEDSPLVSPKNILKLEEQFGRNSDVYRVRVLGEFPEMDPNCVVSSDDLEACSEI
ncbi:MAG: AAA family ATPase, partial [Pseudomonadota bacterium]